MADAVLPILQRRAEIEAAVRAHQVVIVTGETGSGKTTQLPGIVRAVVGPGAVIAHTQPRRLAARAVAARIAEEAGVRLGAEVGYKVRFEDRTSAATRICVATDGVLLAELGSDPQLRAYKAVILDEAHERSLNIDFLIGYLRELLPRRPDLKLVITSATIEPRRFSDFFGGPVIAPVIEVSGRTFPVEVRYRPMGEDWEAAEPRAVVEAVEELTDPAVASGDILVFLPGEREIRQCADLLRKERRDLAVLPLFSRLSNAEQDRIFHPDPAGQRRVILSTNVAETSLTVPGIRHVIDTGLERRDFYDAEKKVSRLPIVPVSRASADQRKGRCGRVAAGVCVRLYAEASYTARPAFTEPQLRRSNLAGVILRMKSLGLTPIERFGFLDPPSADQIRDGHETLFELGAVASRDAGAPLTEIGRHLARLPIDPRPARILLAGAAEGCLEEATILAAALSIQDPRERPMDRQDAADRAQEVFTSGASSDFVVLLNIWDQHRHAAESMGGGALMAWCREHFINAGRMREWSEMAGQLREIAADLGAVFGDRRASEDAIHRAMLAGLISNLACRDGEGGSFEYRGVKGNVVHLFPGSVLFKKGPKWIVAAEIVHTTRLYARCVAKLEPEWIEEVAGHVLQHQVSDPHLDAATGEPSAWSRSTMNGVVVVPRRRIPLAQAQPARARELFIEGAIVGGKWTPTDEGPGEDYLRRIGRSLDGARSLGAKLRRKGAVAADAKIAEWFEKALPPHVRDPATLEGWRRTVPADAGVPGPADLLAGGEDVDPAAYPDEIPLAGGGSPALRYVLAPEADDDGITATVAITDLPGLSVERAEWLVPGWLPELVQALIKSLPKGVRSELERKAGGDPGEIAGGLARVVEFGKGTLGAALSEAAEVLHGVKVEAGQWAVRALPAWLRLRVRVVDEKGEELAASRDVAELHKRLEARVKKARTAGAKGRFERDGITAWDFEPLPESVDVEGPDGPITLYPALIDRRDRVAMTLLASQPEAAAHTQLAVRRLYAILCRDQVGPELESLPGWEDLVRWHGHFGTSALLRDRLTALVAERAFMGGRTAIRTKDDFESRQQAGWGKVSAAVREVADVASRILEPRFKVAGRLSGGTSRHWAASVADLREQAAFLMPASFLDWLPWERLKEFPRYAEGMRARLLGLREDGSGNEKQLLEKFLPHWKRFTAWVAAGMSAARQREEEPVEKQAGAKKGALPPSKRAAPTVNTDAGHWALSPGRLPPAVERYRWALEELRLAMFAPELAAKPAVTEAQVDQLWKSVGSATA